MRREGSKPLGRSRARDAGGWGNSCHEGSVLRSSPETERAHMCRMFNVVHKCTTVSLGTGALPYSDLWKNRLNSLILHTFRESSVAALGKWYS